MRLDHLLSKENCVGQTRGSAIGEGTEVVVQFSVTEGQTVGAVNAQGPPVPIPNTEVKLTGAEDT